MSINVSDLKTARNEAAEEMKGLAATKGKAESDLLKVTQRIATLTALTGAIDALINAQGTGENISAIGGTRLVDGVLKVL